MIGLHQPDVNEEKKMIAIVRYLITYLHFLALKNIRVKNGPGQKWVGSKMGRVKNGRVKIGQVKNGRVKNDLIPCLMYVFVWRSSFTAH